MKKEKNNQTSLNSLSPELHDALQKNLNVLVHLSFLASHWLLVLIQVIATDRDTGAAAAIKYSITTSGTPFRINTNNGLITAAREIR